MKKNYIAPVVDLYEEEVELMKAFSSLTFDETQEVTIDTQETADEFTSRRNNIWSDED